MPKYNHERYDVKPQAIKPMLAEMLKPKDDRTEYDFYLDSHEWVAEHKYDGVRAIITTVKGVAMIQNRHGLDITKKFPEITARLHILPDGIYDSEIVVFINGKEDFNVCQQRVSNFKEDMIPVYAKNNPATCCIFDVMQLGDKKMLDVPYTMRKETLRNIAFESKTFMFSEIYLVPYTVEKRELFEKAMKEGKEGIMLKNTTGIYHEKRHKDWMKLKCFKTVEAYVIGFAFGKEDKNYHDLVGHVALSDGTTYKGGVGGGFSLRDRIIITRLMSKLEVSSRPESVPKGFETDVHMWVKPEIKIKLQILEESKYGRYRFPEFRGFIEDSRITECKNELMEVDYEQYRARFKRA
jgi:bifunctional non-homologous end joining protein LigD